MNIQFHINPSENRRWGMEFQWVDSAVGGCNFLSYLNGSCSAKVVDGLMMLHFSVKNIRNRLRHTSCGLSIHLMEVSKAIVDKDEDGFRKHLHSAIVSTLVHELSRGPHE